MANANQSSGRPKLPPGFLLNPQTVVLPPIRQKSRWSKGGKHGGDPKAHLFKPGQSGNPKGRPKATKLTRRETREVFIKQSGLTPLEFLLSVYRDTKMHMDYRVDAAKAAAPYVHRKMPIAIEGGDPNKPIVFEASSLQGLAPEEKVQLLNLVEKMALSMQVPKDPKRALLEGVARREADADDTEQQQQTDKEQGAE